MLPSAISSKTTNYNISLILGKTSPYQKTYSLSLEKRIALKEYLTKALDKRQICLSSLLVEALILFILKKNRELRLYVDYRSLNAITLKNQYLLSLISNLLDKLYRAQYFSKIDLTNTYYRIRIKVEEEQKTAFRIATSYYKYLVILFGLYNISITFQ